MGINDVSFANEMTYGWPDPTSHIESIFIRLNIQLMDCNGVMNLIPVKGLCSSITQSFQLEFNSIAAV